MIERMRALLANPSTSTSIEMAEIPITTSEQIDLLIEALDTDDYNRQQMAALGLKRATIDRDRCLEAMADHLGPDQIAGDWIADMLGTLGEEAAPAVPKLIAAIRAIDDVDVYTHHFHVDALVALAWHAEDPEPALALIQELYDKTVAAHGPTPAFGGYTSFLEAAGKVLNGEAPPAWPPTGPLVDKWVALQLRWNRLWVQRHKFHYANPGVDTRSDGTKKWDVPIEEQMDAIQNELYDVLDELDEAGIDAKQMPPGNVGDVFWEFQNTGSAAPMVIARMEAIAPNHQDITGFSLLHWAIGRRKAELVEEMLEWGSDPNLQDAGGWTPLHLAAANGDLPVVNALLKGGADKSLTDVEGKTARDLATDKKLAKRLK